MLITMTEDSNATALGGRKRTMILLEITKKPTTKNIFGKLFGDFSANSNINCIV
jgi:hypothetical protein